MRAHKRMHECSSSPPDYVALRAPGPACTRPHTHGRAWERGRLPGRRRAGLRSEALEGSKIRDLSAEMIA